MPFFVQSPKVLGLFLRELVDNLTCWLSFGLTPTRPSLSPPRGKLRRSVFEILAMMNFNKKKNLNFILPIRSLPPWGIEGAALKIIIYCILGSVNSKT